MRPDIRRKEITSAHRQRDGEASSSEGNRRRRLATRRTLRALDVLPPASDCLVVIIRAFRKIISTIFCFRWPANLTSSGQKKSSKSRCEDDGNVQVEELTPPTTNAATTRTRESLRFESGFRNSNFATRCISLSLRAEGFARTTPACCGFARSRILPGLCPSAAISCVDPCQFGRSVSLLA